MAERSRGGAKTPRARVPVSEAALAEAALAYLDRFDASRDKLASKLEAWVRRRGEPPDPVAARPLIAALLARYEASGLIDDTRLARSAVARLRARGASTRAIQHRLRHHGVAASAIDAALGDEARGAAELEAARAFVARRRLGTFRPEAARQEHRRRDLAALARAGFGFDTAIQALGPTKGTDEDF